MSTKAEYRLSLQHTLLALEDGGYGDFEYSNAELDSYLESSVARLFPALYKKLSVQGQTLTTYGTNLLAGFTFNMSDRVFLVEDATERDTVVGWIPRPDSIINIDDSIHPDGVNFYYYDAYELPDDDVTDAGISAIYKPLIVLGAQIEALEARQDTGVRGEPQPTGPFFETGLLDRLVPRYNALKSELAMAMPAVTF